MPFTPFDRVDEIFDRVLAASVADETELVWFERARGAAVHGSSPDAASPAGRPARPLAASGRAGESEFLEPPRLTVLVRVIESGRPGWHRTAVSDPNELESGVRQAIALARAHDRIARKRVLPTPEEVAYSGDSPPEQGFRDPAIEELDPDTARELLDAWAGPGSSQPRGSASERLQLHWSTTRLLVRNSHGVSRRAASTEVSLEARSRPARGEALCGAGYAAASARTLAGLEGPRVVERARQLATPNDQLGAPTEDLPVVLSSEAVAVLLDTLNAFALAGRAYLDGTSFLSRHRGVQVFDSALHLRDDGASGEGLPFPFDLEGNAKRPLDLIVAGCPSTPALDHVQGARAGLRPTAGSVGGGDTLFGNLFLAPGDASHEELLAAADGGLYIGWLEPPECLEPARLEMRTIARGVRRIEKGRLGLPVEALLWEDSLLRVLSKLRGIGRSVEVRSMPSTPLGAIATPALAVDRAAFQSAG